MNYKDKKDKQSVQYPFKHSMPVQIRFNDIDTLGHVNNSVYFPFYDLGKANYFNAAKHEVIDWKKTDIVVANINCDFCAPIYFNEKIEVQTQVEHIYDKSFKMLQRLINIETAEVKCICTTIMVGFDTAKGVAAPLSNEWKMALAEFEGRNLETEK
ncbi:MAG: thioesterase family protein [Muribaculaceae bacterium]